MKERGRKDRRKEEMKKGEREEASKKGWGGRRGNAYTIMGRLPSWWLIFMTT